MKNLLPALLPFAFLLQNFSVGFCQNQPFYLQNDKLETPILLDTFITFATDSTGQLGFDSVKKLAFHRCSGSFFLNKNYAYWFRLPICNSGTDSLRVLLCTDRFVYADLFYEKNNGGCEQRKAGSWTNFSDRSFQPNKFCHPISLASGEECEYFVRISDYVHIDPALPNLRLLSYGLEKELRLEEAMNKSGKLRYHGIFYGILAIMTVFSLLQFHSTQDRAYLYYAGYAIAILLFFIRGADLQNPPIFFRDLKSLHPNFEAPFGYLCYIFYLSFVRQFLDTKNNLPRLDRYMYGGIAVFTILFAIDLLIIQPIWGWRVSMEVNSYSKLPFFVLALWTALPSVFTLQNKLAVYILFGTSLLLLPAFFTVFCDLMPGSYKILWSHTARSFTLNNSGIMLYMYDMKIGVMLEMFCFVLGLSYKTKQDRLRMQMLGSEVEKLKNENLALIPSNDPTGDPFIAEVRKIVEANLGDENFSAETLANAMHLGRVQLYRKMMASAKVPPSDFIRSVRIATAKNGLRNTTKSISEIAFEVGFKDASHFSNAFNKIVGIRPSKYRELQSQNSTISPSNGQNET